MMKVTCKNCGKRFDYDLYMGLCPKCSTYYREGKQYHTENKETAGVFLRGEEWPPQSQRQVRQTEGQPRRAQSTYRKVKTPKHSSAYYIVSFVLLFAIAAGAVVPMVFRYRENLSGHEEMTISEELTEGRVSVGEPFSYSGEQGDYQVIITGAKIDKRKDLATPKHYQYVAVSYEIVPPGDMKDQESWSDNPSYYGIHMRPYLITKSGKYLEPLYTFQIADRMGWDSDRQRQLGLSDDFQYQNGVLYFLAMKGDVEGLLVNSFDYDEGNYSETTLRESFEVTGLAKAIKGE